MSGQLVPGRAGRLWGVRWAGVLALAGALGVAGSGGAAAHVVLDLATANADGSTTLTFSFNHGCDGRATIGLDMSIPQGVEVLDTTQPEGWSAEVAGSSVVWSGGTVADGDVGTFQLVTTVAGLPGEEFVFPVVQRCDEGWRYEWTDTDADSSLPAPSFIATAATLTSSDAFPTADADAVTGSGGASSAQALWTVAVTAVLLAVAGMFVGRPRSDIG